MAFVYRGEKVDLGFGRGWMDRPAADSIRRIDAALGHPMQITEAGRTWDEQNAHYQRYRRYLAGGPWAPIALSPDAPSIHQKGYAADSNEAQRFVALLEDHGWRRTVYRYVNGKWTLVEPWHFEYSASLDKHRAGSPSGGGGNNASTGWDEMATKDEIKAALEEVLNAQNIGPNVRFLAEQANGWVDKTRPVEGQLATAISRVTEILFAVDGRADPRIKDAEGKPVVRALAAFLQTRPEAPSSNVDVDEAAIIDGVVAGLAADLDSLVTIVKALPAETIAALKAAL